MKQLLVGLVLVGAVAACATSGGTATRTNSREITRAEVEAAEGVSTAYDLIQRLRPHWLRYRGTSSMTREGAIVVYVDGLRVGQIVGEGSSSTGPNPLSGMAASLVERAVYYSASAATQKFGTGHAHGAIEVVTR